MSGARVVSIAITRLSISFVCKTLEFASIISWKVIS